MCLIVDRNKFKLIIAKNSITVYKIVERKYCDGISKGPLRNIVMSFHRGYHYINDIKQKHIDIIIENITDYNNSNDVHFQIHKGYHYYTSLEYAIKFHETVGTICAAEFIIPKGIKYYNDNNYGVCEQIIFKRIIPTKEINRIRPKTTTVYT